MAWLWLAALPSPGAVAQEPKARQAELQSSLDRAAALYRNKRFDDFRALVSEVRAALDQLARTGDAERLLPLVAPVERRLAAAERLVKRLDAPSGSAATSRPATGAVSFTRSIAPILLAKCANCHIRQSRGMFSMATFEALERGSEAGRVYSPGMGDGSRLIQVLETGDMPRGGGSMLPAEIGAIRRWIDEGAKFDGTDRTAPIAGGAASATPQSATPQLARATGDEQVQFIRDLAPVLLANCAECHGGANPAERLSFDNFNTLLRGGQSGAIVAPGKPRDSLLIQKLRGAAAIGERMPRGRPPLPDETIARFETWIAEGAKFDGDNPVEPLDVTVRVAAARRMSHDELAAMRLDLARKNWRIADASSTPIVVEADDVVLVGNLTQGRMDEIKAIADAERDKVASLLKARGDLPLVKGRATLFVFDRRFNYSEFVRMVEQRELPPAAHGHFRYDVIDAYGCVPSADGGDADLAALIAEQLAGLAVASIADAPRWFSIGVGRSVAASVESRSLVARAWNDAAGGAARTVDDVDAFLVARYPDPAACLAFVKTLRANAPQFNRLLEALRDGAPFDRAFRDVYGADAKTRLTAWLGRAAGARAK